MEPLAGMAADEHAKFYVHRQRGVPLAAGQWFVDTPNMVPPVGAPRHDAPHEYAHLSCEDTS